MIQIGTNRFEVPTPGGMASFAFQQRVLPIAGRVVNVFLHLLGKVDITNLGDLLAQDVITVLPAAMPAIGHIFSEMPAGELEAITRTLLRDAKWGGGKDAKPLFGSSGGDAFDALMQGKTLDTWKLLWHALEVWYPDFFALAATMHAPSAKENHSEESITSESEWPCWRLVAKKWASIPEVEGMSRTRILDANEMLDALEEAEDEARAKAEAARKRGS